jgi:hypothetical protein
MRGGAGTHTGPKLNKIKVGKIRKYSKEKKHGSQHHSKYTSCPGKCTYSVILERNFEIELQESSYGLVQETPKTKWI